MEQATHAHWYALGLLMLAGLNIPVSEDLVVIGCAVLAGSVVPQNFEWLLACAFAGAYLSDLENYWLARIVGPRLLKFRLVASMLPPEKVERTKAFMDRYGPLTLVFGRFVPFGVRNAQFTTAGLSKMNFARFALFDFVGCVMTTAVLFSLGYHFGKNYNELLGYLSEFKVYIFGVAIVAVLIALGINRRRKARAQAGTADP